MNVKILVKYLDILLCKANTNIIGGVKVYVAFAKVKSLNTK